MCIRSTNKLSGQRCRLWHSRPVNVNSRHACHAHVENLNNTHQHQGGYGATVARLTPDQKLGSSNLSVLICADTDACKLR